MATIVYKCDTCGRQIELIENKYGITCLNNCIITNNCKGNLYSIKRNQNTSRQSIIKYISSNENYEPRKLFYSHTQTITSLIWTINHNLSKSCTVIIYDNNQNIINSSEYKIDFYNTYCIITFNTPTSGTAHIINRTEHLSLQTNKNIIETEQISFNDILTFAIPKYITRITSTTKPDAIIIPTPTPTPVPNQPYEICNELIKLEIEIQRPNEDSITCEETLENDALFGSPWYGIEQILVANRKHYCIRSFNLTKLKIFKNINSDIAKIPDGTKFKIKRISYNDSVFVNIPDRGLLILLSKLPHTTIDKDLNRFFDCGEMVKSPMDFMTFTDKQLYIDSNIIENTYPPIKKYR